MEKHYISLTKINQAYSKCPSSMIQTKHLFILFIPALLFIFFALRSQMNYSSTLQSVLSPETTDKANTSLIPIFPEDPTQGTSNASTTIIIFEDLACEGCKYQNSLLSQLEKKFPGKIKIVTKLLSVTTFPYNTEKAHDSAYCASQQYKFATFRDEAFANNTKLSPTVVDTLVKTVIPDMGKFTTCMQSEAPATYRNKNENIARSVGIQEVPTIFVNQKQVQPASSLELWENILGL